MFCCLSIWICILMMYSMLNYQNTSNSFMFIFCVNFLLFMLFLVFSVMDFFFFYFFFEASLIPIFLIIFGWGYQPERLSAGYFLIFYTLFASLPFLFIVFYVFSVNGTFCFFFPFSFSSNFMMFFILFSFLVSFPMFGVHLWLPKAHVEAPVGGSMVLAGVLLKLGGYGFFRSLGFMYFFIVGYDYLFISFCLVGCLYMSMFCMIQSDLSILIAYSSVCHMGMVIMGLFTLSYWGVLGSLVFMIGHGFVSSGLFYLVGLVYSRFGSRSFFLISGLILYMPSVSLFWFFFCVLNMSCPPSINLFSEISLFFSLVSWDFIVTYYLFFVFFLSACYSLSIFFLSHHGNDSCLLKFIYMFVRFVNIYFYFYIFILYFFLYWVLIIF
uniref:NADH dehydrogenase subunit 4 n=1 Tax=Pseudochoutagus curvativus TaxID=3081119 RepID=UPI002A7F3ECC|nr:NADH dehydrogenase subunit 4 [Pseudochoutagus curvativus]WOW98900.1 NADH dehydrogenase subunit 4 [Pseudochoutagus curvativus]